MAGPPAVRIVDLAYVTVHVSTSFQLLNDFSHTIAFQKPGGRVILVWLCMQGRSDPFNDWLGRYYHFVARLHAWPQQSRTSGERAAATRSWTLGGGVSRPRGVYQISEAMQEEAFLEMRPIPNILFPEHYLLQC